MKQEPVCYNFTDYLVLTIVICLLLKSVARLLELLLIFLFSKAGDETGKNEMIMMKSLVWEVKVAVFEDFTEGEEEEGGEEEDVEEQTLEVWK